MPVDDLWMKGPKGARVKSARYGRGKRYRVRYVDDNNKPHGPLFEKKRDAEAFDVSVRSDVARGHYLNPQDGKITLRAFTEAWFSQQIFDEATRQTVESRLNTQILPTLGKHQLNAVKASTVQSFVRGMQTSGLAARYIQTITGLLSTILAAAVDDGRMPKNPCGANSIRLPTVRTRKVVPWTVDRVLAVAGELPDPYEATIYAGYGIGMRQGEIFGLALDELDFLGRNVHVSRQVRIVRNTLVFAPPKGGKERDVPLSAEVALRLSAHIKLFPPQPVTLPWLVPDGKRVTAELLFVNAGSAIHRSWFNHRVWTPALQAADVAKEPTSRGHGMHILRHSYASTLLADGVDIRALAEYLGHTDPGFTLRTYTHLMPKVEDRARAAIDAAFRDVGDHRAQIGHRLG